MKTEQLCSDIYFAKIENLKGRAHEIAQSKGLKEGLVLVKVTLHPVPKYDIQPITGDPLEAMKEIAASDGISQEKLNKAFGEFDA